MGACPQAEACPHEGRAPMGGVPHMGRAHTGAVPSWGRAPTGGRALTGGVPGAGRARARTYPLAGAVAEGVERHLAGHVHDAADVGVVLPQRRQADVQPPAQRRRHLAPAAQPLPIQRRAAPRREQPPQSSAERRGAGRGSGWDGGGKTRRVAWSARSSAKTLQLF